MKQFGLIGKTLMHSFSKKYFEDKFRKEQIKNCKYDLFELPSIASFPQLITEHHSSLVGLNVTIPYKLEVIPFLSSLDENAKAINAVNTIKVNPDGELTGFNTDYYGFKNSLMDGWDLHGRKALILGTGGASNAVKKVLEDLGIPYLMVSRHKKDDTLDYSTLKENPELVIEHQLIINSTPLGTFPDINLKPDLPYSSLSGNHLLFDLVYNPEVTAFMNEGIRSSAKVKNGYHMLVGQAEAAWEIWNG